MKWIIRRGKFPPGLPDAEKSLFEEIDLQKEDGDPALEDELKNHDMELWVKYPGTENNFAPISRLGSASCRKYEIFCGGFLYYHDVELKKKIEGKDFEHKIYFEWLPPGDQNEKNEFRIYINSTPPQFNPNPPPPPPPPPPES